MKTYEMFSIAAMSKITGHSIPNLLEAHKFHCPCPWCASYRTFCNATPTEQMIARQKLVKAREMSEATIEEIQTRLARGETHFSILSSLGQITRRHDIYTRDKLNKSKGENS